MNKSVIIIAIAIACISCVNRDDNRKIVEAREIHLKTMGRYDSLMTALGKEESKLKSLMEREPDSEKQSIYQSMTRSIDRSKTLLYTWEESVIGVPGLPERPHDHTPGHKHDHSDQSEVLKTLSDEEILSFQKAYAAKLEELAEKVDELLTTMKMHEYYGE